MFKFLYIFYFLLLSTYAITGKKNNVLIDDEFLEFIKVYENPNKKGYKNGKWKPIKSPEGGTPTIAYGHKLTNKEYYSGVLYNGLNWKKGIDDEDAIDLLISDLHINIDKAQKIFYHFDEYPIYVKRALINSCFRGEVRLTKKWVKMINDNNWGLVNSTYLDNSEYRRAKRRYSGPGGLAHRMEWNAEQFAFYAFTY